MTDEEFSKILRISDDTSKLHAADVIDRLRAENKELEGALQGSRDALQACVDDCNALREDVAKERERCAKIVETYEDPHTGATPALRPKMAKAIRGT